MPTHNTSLHMNIEQVVKYDKQHMTYTLFCINMADQVLKSSIVRHDISTTCPVTRKSSEVRDNCPADAEHGTLE